ncbi:DUF4376 domain-containing protein [Lonepinella koalarum]|uniref:DUF4376 domain-containing protein n=1 Tax=Lonepinella koalarum TaxID=53417 RepID=UPI001E2B1612|nr:DUF4376 domain-containing protein [Lonepinella koalarum]
MIQFDEQGFALASGEITVYTADSNNEFSGATTEFVSVGGGLSANSYLDSPPKVKNGFAIIRENNNWQYVEDHRGKTVYSTLDRSSLEIKELGDIPENYTAVRPENDYCEWNGTQWMVSVEKQAEIKANQQTQMWEKIKQKRYDNGRNGVYVKSVDKWFHTDDVSRQQYTFLRTLESFPDTDWKVMDNSFIKLNKALLDELSLAIFNHEQADFRNAEMHRIKMLQAENPLDYDYATGWSATYGN